MFNSRKYAKVVFFVIVVIAITPLFAVFSLAASAPFTVESSLSSSDIVDASADAAYVVATSSSSAKLIYFESNGDPLNVVLQFYSSGNRPVVRANYFGSSGDSFTVKCTVVDVITGSSSVFDFTYEYASPGQRVFDIMSVSGSPVYAYSLSGYKFNNIDASSDLIVSSPFVKWTSDHHVDSVSSLFTFLADRVKNLVQTIVSSPLLMIGLGIFGTGAVIGLGYRLIRG